MQLTGRERHREALHFAHEPGKEFQSLRGGDGVARHFAHGISGIDGIDEREIGAFARSAAAQLFMRSARSAGFVRRHCRNAARAAATAASTSAAPASATEPISSPVPGLMTAFRSPERGLCQPPA